jgi:quercetin dioxygenase-like cupin family protein
MTLLQYKLKNKPSINACKELLDSITEEDWKNYLSPNGGIPAQQHTSRIKVIHYKSHPLSIEEEKRHQFWPGSEYFKEEHHPIYNSSRPIREFLQWFERTYGGTIHRVSVVRLLQGKSVYEHIDGGTYYKNKDRFHLVLQGSYLYTVEEQNEVYKTGDLFWFDNKKYHRSTNIGDCARISLIFDASNSEWREAVRKE